MKVRSFLLLMGMGIDDVEETNCKVFVHFLCMFVYTNVVFLRLLFWQGTLFYCLHGGQIGLG